MENIERERGTGGGGRSRNTKDGAKERTRGETQILKKDVGDQIIGEVVREAEKPNEGRRTMKSVMEGDVSPLKKNDQITKNGRDT